MDNTEWWAVAADKQREALREANRKHLAAHLEIDVWRDVRASMLSVWFEWSDREPHKYSRKTRVRRALARFDEARARLGTMLESEGLL